MSNVSDYDFMIFFSIRKTSSRVMERSQCATAIYLLGHAFPSP